jgi:hypothetical protein
LNNFDSLAGLVVTAGQIWPFLQVAMLTTPAGVHWVIITAMLFGNDVIDMKGKKGLQFVRQATILTPVVCSLANEIAQLLGDHQAAELASRARAFDCRIEINLLART